MKNKKTLILFALFAVSVYSAFYSQRSYELERQRLLDEDPNFFLAGWTQDPRSEIIKGLDKQRMGFFSISIFSNIILIYTFRNLVLKSEWIT